MAKSRDYLTVGDLVGKLDHLNIEYAKCGRSGHDVPFLRGQHALEAHRLREASEFAQTAFC
jgi:hypothetical protein